MDTADLRAVAWIQNYSIGRKFNDWAEIFSGKLEIGGGQKVRGLAGNLEADQRLAVKIQLEFGDR
jgi:hypothetical protein